MALKKITEIPTIDVVLVTIKSLAEGAVDEYALDTASKIGVSPQIETTEGVKLIIKNKLKAQKPEESTLTGHQIILTDNTFAPEVVKVVQGGVISYDAVEVTKVIGYTPPVVGSSEKGEPFELSAYSAQYNAAGEIVRYEKITYPNCKGKPIAFSSEDGVFRVPEYTILSTPDTGVAPYTITYIDTLPVVA
jgi:hypothetical protein